MKDLILVGGGGHCKSVIEVIESAGGYNIVGILDKPEFIGESMLGYEIIGSDNDIAALSKTVKDFLITIGQIKSSRIRRNVYENLIAQRVNLPSIIASSARVSRHAKIGMGTVIHHNAFVNAGVSIGDCCIINSGATIEHDSFVGNFCHISTNVAVNGTCVIGNDTFIGSGTTINNNISIGSNCVIASASLIRNSVEDNAVAYGIPGKVTYNG